MPLCVVCGDWARIQPEDWAGEHHQYCPLAEQVGFLEGEPVIPESFPPGTLRFEKPRETADGVVLRFTFDPSGQFANTEAIDLITDADYPAIPCGAD